MDDAAITSGVLKAAAAEGGGFGNAVLASHHFGAGSLYSFTFSEFLEGIVFVALELYPPPATLVRAVTPTASAPSGAMLTAAHVLKVVEKVLTECIMPRAKRGGVLEFRRLVRPHASTAVPARAPAHRPNFILS